MPLTHEILSAELFFANSCESETEVSAISSYSLSSEQTMPPITLSDSNELTRTLNPPTKIFLVIFSFPHLSETFAYPAGKNEAVNKLPSPLFAAVAETLFT